VIEPDQNPVTPELAAEIIHAATDLSVEATKQVALFKVVQILPNDARKAAVIREITKRLAMANKAFAAVLEGYAV
jgi:hypothetical protein